MARTTQIIEAPRLNDLTVGAVTTAGLFTQVNAYLAGLVNPTIRGWNLAPKIIEKRMNIQWEFDVTWDSGGAALANPFTLNVIQATSPSALSNALATLYGAILPAQFLTAPRIVKLDEDGQQYTKQYVSAMLQNLLAAGGASNYINTQA